jgi:pimeloyl-ACP methyl ester carboxylesterase
MGSIYGRHTQLAGGIAVRSAGTGRGLVLLHANGGDHRDFDAIVDTLARDWLVHAIDWPGHGDSQHDSNSTAVGYASALGDVLRELPGGPFILVGNSVGGFAAIGASAAHPELVRGLVLVSPGGFTPRWPLTVAACRLIASRGITPVAMRWLPRLYLRRRNEHVRAIQDRATAASRDQAARATFSSLWRSFADRQHDARSLAGQITIPVQLCWGRFDPILPWPIDGRRARRAFTNPTVTRFTSGHQPFAEVPEEFLRDIAPFLDQFRTGQTR